MSLLKIFVTNGFQKSQLKKNSMHHDGEYPQVEEDEPKAVVTGQIDEDFAHVTFKRSYDYTNFSDKELQQEFSSAANLKLPTGRWSFLTSKIYMKENNLFLKRQIHALFGPLVDGIYRYAMMLMTEEVWNLQPELDQEDLLVVKKGARAAARRTLDFYNKLLSQGWNWQLFCLGVIEHFDLHLGKILDELLGYSRLFYQNSGYSQENSNLYATDLGAYLKKKIEEDTKYAVKTWGNLVMTHKTKLFGYADNNEIIVSMFKGFSMTFLTEEYGSQSSENIVKNLAAAAIRDSIGVLVFPKLKEKFSKRVKKCKKVELVFKEFYAQLLRMRTTYMLLAGPEIWEPFSLQFTIGGSFFQAMVDPVVAPSVIDAMKKKLKAKSEINDQ